jgi:hypothetical protein
MFKFCSQLLIGLFLISPLLGASDANRRVSTKSLTTHITYLASEELAGRGVGQPGEKLAADYIAKHFKEYGLIPAGDEGSFFQTFDIPFSRTNEELTFPGQTLTAQKDTDFAYLPFSSEGDFEGSIVFVGYGATAEEEKHDDYADVDVEGKVVMMFRYVPEEWAADGGMPNAHALFTTKAELALKHHAKAVVIVNPPREEKDTLFSQRGSRARREAIPMIHVSRRLATKLLTAGGLEDVETVHRKLAEGKHCSALLRGVTIKGHLKKEKMQAQARNVIGVLRGEGPLADEFVVIGGHYDHIGHVPATRQPIIGHVPNLATDEIHNGADDNASGTAGIIELARVYANGAKPKRSIVFMAFTAEEAGLIGSGHFVKHPTVPLEKMVTMINLDMIGRLEGRPLEIYGTKSSPIFEEMLDSISTDLDIEMKYISSGTGPSDHTHFYNNGIPVMFLHAGLHGDYHTPRDDIELLDMEGTTKVIEVAQAIADRLIESTERPPYQVTSSQRRAPASDVSVRMGFMPSYGDAEENGWPIGGVVAGGPAAKAGMKDGDRILSIDGKSVKDIYDYMDVMGKYKPKDVVKVKVTRDGKELEISVTLEPR